MINPGKADHFPCYGPKGQPLIQFRDREFTIFASYFDIFMSIALILLRFFYLLTSYPQVFHAFSACG